MVNFSKFFILFACSFFFYSCGNVHEFENIVSSYFKEEIHVLKHESIWIGRDQALYYKIKYEKDNHVREFINDLKLSNKVEYTSYLERPAWFSYSINEHKKNAYHRYDEDTGQLYSLYWNVECKVIYIAYAKL